MIFISNLEKYQSKNPIQTKIIERFVKKIGENLSDIKYNSLIDIGCGEGLFLQKLNSLYPINKKIKVYGIDLNEESLKLAKYNFPMGNFKKGNVYKIPFKKNSFDLGLCLEVLEHLDKPDKCIEEIRRVSKNAIMSVPNSLVFRSLNFIRFKNIKRFGEDKEHIQRFNPESFKSLLEKYFKQIKIIKSTPWLIGICKN